MESLGPYLLRRPLELGGGTKLGDGRTLTVFEAQDARTGIPVLVYRPLAGQLPAQPLEGCLQWLEALPAEEGTEPAWVAELPLGAVSASRYLGSAPAERLRDWALGLAETLEKADARGLEHGAIRPERVWVKGSRAWLEGLGLPIAGKTPDRRGLLDTVQSLAGSSWASLPWREALEAWADREITAAELHERIEHAETPPPPVEPKVVVPDPVEPETVEESPRGEELLEQSPAPEIEQPEPVTVAAPKSKASLKVEITEENTPAEPVSPPPVTAPKKVRIDEPLEPPFSVIDPGRNRSRGVPVWLRWLVVALLVAGIAFVGYRFWPRPVPVTQGYTVEFRVEPSGQSARVELLEAPEGSSLLPGTVIATVPGPVFFDKTGVYRLRIRVDGRDPRELLLDVPAPNGVNINLR